MTLSKAINILKDIKINLPLIPLTDLGVAIELGIEALEREQILRHEVPYDRDGLLPGETEE